MGYDEMFRVMVLNAADGSSIGLQGGHRDFHRLMDGWTDDVVLWPPVTNEYS